MVGAELSFKAVRSMPEGCSHHSRVCDDHVKEFALGSESVGTGAHALQIGEIELDKLKIAAFFGRFRSDLGGCRFRLGLVPGRTHDLCAMHC
jgi:hypothetical protein